MLALRSATIRRVGHATSVRRAGAAAGVAGFAFSQAETTHCDTGSVATGFAGAAIGAAIVSLLPSLARSPQLAVAETEPGLRHYIPDQTDPRVVTIAKECRYYSPKFSPKDVPAFYDLSGLTENPRVFQRTMDVFIERYRAQAATGKGPTVIVGYDARGFVVGPPIALALGIPFVLLRKAGKNPGPLVESSAYSKEYAEKQPDRMCVRLGAIVPGDRVVLIDDLIATGGTALSGFELCSSLGAEVHEFAAIIELPDLGPDFPGPHPGVKKIREWEGGKFGAVPIFTVVDSTTIDKVRPQNDDPPAWSESSKVVDMKDAGAALLKYPELGR